jgi:predicted small lipoprotein YifL
MQGVAMRLIRLSAMLLSMTLASALVACGNKGDLVKRIPPPDQQPATQSPPDAPDSTPKPAESGMTPASPQDSGGH